MSHTIYCDNLIEASWFQALSPCLNGAAIKKIAQRGENPPVINELVRYDRPDIILLDAERPILVVEKTQEVPTGHNVGQRIARLVRSAEMQVPTIKFFPFDAMKHGEYAGVCNLNIRILKVFENMSRIHGVPILAVNWRCDKYSELLDDGTEDEQMREIVSDYIRSGYNPACDAIVNAQKAMQREYEIRLRKRKSYGIAPPSVEKTETSALLKKTEGLARSSGIEALLKRKESVVYHIAMTPDKCRREDPYTGTQFIYDYLWCRNGPNVEDKERNLFLHFPEIEQSYWMSRNPDDPTRKSSNWYLTANAMIFADSVLLIRE